MSIFFRKKETPPSPIISSVLISAVFGLAAGVVGMLFVAGYYSVPQPLTFSTGLSFPREKTPPLAAEIERAATSVEMAARSLVFFYPAKSAETGLIAGQPVLLPSQAVGAGLILTSDGWLVTHDSILAGPAAKRLSETVAVVGSKRYAVRETVRDPFTDVIFAKIDGSNLPVVAFGNDELAAGDQLFAFDAAGGIRRMAVIGLADRPLADIGGAVRSSEKMQKYLRVSADDEVLPGSLVLDNQGQVVGVYVGRGAVGSLVVPFDSFSSVIGGVLRDKNAHRTYLGVNYLDLAGLRSSGAAKGVLLTASLDSKRPAVIRQSPAAKAGLRDGDVIVSVNGEDITANKALAEMIAEYAPESAVKLTVERGAKTITVEAVLGELPPL